MTHSSDLSPTGTPTMSATASTAAMSATAATTSTGSAIVVDRVRKTFTTGGTPVTALHDVELDIPAGTFVSLVGPSGCGKSTLLEVIAGLTEATSGRVYLDGSPVTTPRRTTGVMFQRPVLFPWRDVLKNILLPIEVSGASRARHEERARQLISLASLDGFERAYPRELSGGMQQRVALCRLLITEPNVLLMDEPFGALDEFTRERLNLELARIWQKQGQTVVFVTHNISEAVFLSDHVIVMTSRPGRIVEQVPIDLPRPRTSATYSDSDFLDHVVRIRACFGGDHLD